MLIACITLALASCQKDRIGTENESDLSMQISDLERVKLYNEFAIVLSKAVVDNPELRKFIKEEALRKVDNDHDVFYNFIKDRQVQNNETFKDVLRAYESYPNQLDIIEKGLPLLTIFVPTITMSKFSPDTWDSANEVPMVATNIMKSDGNIPVYDNGEELLTLSSNEVPGFPVLVVKPNERIKVKDGQNLRSSTNAANGSPSFEFVSSAFDGQVKQQVRRGTTASEPSYRTSSGINIDPSIVRAFNLFGVSNEKWQRDHIYYNLTEENPTGRLNLNMVETIVSFTISRAALSKISDQTGDPVLTPNSSQIIDIPFGAAGAQLNEIIQKNAWTDGQFEFRFDILINNKKGVGNAHHIYYPISPTKLFHIPYSTTNRRVESGREKLTIVYVLEPSPRGGSSVTGSNEIIVNLPIINWDIQSNAPLWKISLYEVDSQEVIETKESVTNEFAANFSVNAGVDSGLKLGFNFGSSSKETFTKEITIRRTAGDDDLGSVFVDFGHPVISGTESRGRLALHEYKNEYFSLKVIPTRAY